MSVSPSGSSNTICFTSARTEPLFTTNHLDELNSPECRYQVHRMMEQCDQARERFWHIIEDLNEPIREQVDEFIDDSLDVNGEHPFASSRSERLHGAFLQLDMQLTDHEPIFDMIERVVKKRKKIHFVRLSPLLMKKRNLLEILEPIKRFSVIFILVEQTETMSNNTTQTLISHVRGKLQDVNCPTKIVLFLFCNSTTIQSSPLDTLDCFCKLKTIHRDRDKFTSNVKRDLLFNDKALFRLGPEALCLIYECFIEQIPSIVNLELMYTHVLCEYTKQLEEFKNSPLIKGKLAGKDINHDRVQACEYHSFICDQLEKYYYLLRESGLFPEDITDLYDELFAVDDLGHSTNFVDSVKRLSKLSSAIIIKRINAVELNTQALLGKNTLTKMDVLKILSFYKSKLDNNEDSAEIIKDLVDKLLKHSQYLRSPESMGFGYLYFNDEKLIIKRTLYSARDKNCLWGNITDEETYFGTLFNLINKSPGHIYMDHLFIEASPYIKKLVKKNLESSKSTARSPRKRTRKTDAKNKDTDADQTSEKVIDQLTKSIFLDLISDMEQNQLIKQDKRASRSGNLRRLIWR